MTMAGRMMIIVAAAAFFFLAFAGKAAGEDTLFGGETLEAGGILENGPYKLVMQEDCNLVLYKNGTQVLWSSGTNGVASACHATLESSGNLVVFSGAGDILWDSGSSLGPNTYRLVVQSDGNAVIYGAALWATNTEQN